MNAVKTNPWFQKILNEEKQLRKVLDPNTSVRDKNEIMASMSARELEYISSYLAELLELSSEHLLISHNIQSSYHIDHLS